MKARTLSHGVWEVLTSLKLTIVCLAALMVLVVSCTLAQVHLGLFGAVNAYMRSWLIWWKVPGTAWMVAIFPGGALVGLVLIVNLFAAQLRRLELSWKKSGLWIAHAGLILLVAGEFVTSLAQIDTQMAIEEGQTVNFVESPREMELALVDASDPGHDDVYGVPEGMLARGGDVAVPGTPITLRVKRYMLNAELATRGPGDSMPLANQGVGASVVARELPASTVDEVPNRRAVWVEPVAGGRSLGTWLASNALGAPQGFIHEGRTYRLEMRSRRYYLPYAITLKKFSHDVYEGTDIPKNFSSLVHVSNPARGESRDVLIYMNQPLRYEGRTFYQASFGKNDTLSILQVVKNPGWLLPYVSCVLVTLGLLVHFAITLRRSARRRSAPGGGPALEAA